ncbi:UNKNOWN [Stylonychia lemnae]|uniref:Uncharacterized protein n=1 Tax=Stylonychia lemnae TaxID=5949 RepID=A0A078A247_STYLE|nr:UNKNOWN [Stylonychia lemnae]|eukprot:CDW76306.1 UNKNOWN [Stylonychia lemnae]
MHKAMDLHHHPQNFQLRVSIEVPNTPRFIMTFAKEQYLNVKQFISHVCQQTGLDESQKYLLMLDDAVIVSIESIRDNDRLCLVQAKAIIQDQKQQTFCQNVAPGAQNNTQEQMGTPMIQNLNHQVNPNNQVTTNVRLNPETPGKFLLDTFKQSNSIQPTLQVNLEPSMIPMRR